MNKGIKLSTIGKLNYIFHFFWHKLIIPFECKKGALEMLFTEAFVLLNNTFGLGLVEQRLFKRTYFETIFGKFHINPSIICTYTVSPAFERTDIDYLLRLMDQTLKKRKKVLFIDVGAYVGLYTVAVGNAFKKYKSNLDIIAFEPEANNFMGDNFNLIKKNVKENKIKNVKVYKIGLGVTNSTKLNRFGILTKKLDTVLGKRSEGYDTIFIKMDIEGQETDALKGAREFLRNSKEVVLLVEDFIDKKLINYLKNNNFVLLNKISFKNSFWIKK